MTDPLGKGLESLIPKKDDAPIEDSGLSPREPRPAPQASPQQIASVSQRPSRREESTFWIDVSKIEPNPQQPRRVFDIDELASLTASVREHGILQPLVVTKRE